MLFLGRLCWELSLLTGYLGGAVASHARLGDPLLTHTLFGVYVGVSHGAAFGFATLEFER